MKMMKSLALVFVVFAVIEGRKLVRRDADEPSNEEPGWCKKQEEKEKFCKDANFKKFCFTTCADVKEGDNAANPSDDADETSDPSCCSSFTQLCHVGDFRKICPSTCKEPTCCSSLKHLCHLDDLKKKCFSTCSQDKGYTQLRMTGLLARDA